MLSTHLRPQVMPLVQPSKDERVLIERRPMRVVQGWQADTHRANHVGAAKVRLDTRGKASYKRMDAISSHVLF